MATFRIHQDQENIGVPDLRQKQGKMATANNQKRMALSVIGNQPLRQIQVKEKQPLGISKENKKNINASIPVTKTTPVIPVAQFQAFKVYEDFSKENIVSEKNIEDIDKENKAPPGQLIIPTKQEWFTKESNGVLLPKLEDIKPPKIDSDLLKPRGILSDVEDLDKSVSIDSFEKSLLKKKDAPGDAVAELKSTRDLFFDNEEYRSDIYMYLKQHELNSRPKPGYMRKQPDITYSMRTILVDWLVEVAQEYKLQTETLYLTINYIDRFLSYMSVVRGKLQLVGTAAMFIAAKYEEIYPPEVGEFVYITDDTYTKQQVIRMEHLILKVLGFELSIPTPLTFIKALAVSTSLPNKVIYLAMYLCELSMLDAEPYLENLPSVLAAAAIATSRYVLNMEPWNEELQVCSGYKTRDIKKTIQYLYLLFCRAPSQAQQAIQEKYNCSKYLNVSKLLPKTENTIFPCD